MKNNKKTFRNHEKKTTKHKGKQRKITKNY